MVLEETMRRGAWTILEILIAAVIFAFAVGMVVFNLVSSRRQSEKLDVLITARFLAQSILDSAAERFALSDRRYFTTATPLQQIARDREAGKWKAAFLKLAQAKVPVRAGSGSYFDPATGPVWPSPMAPEDQRFFASFSYEVTVAFDLAKDEGGAPVPLDTDGDGKPQTDLARVEVIIHHQPPDGTLERPVVRLSTLLIAPDQEPGALLIKKAAP